MSLLFLEPMGGEGGNGAHAIDNAEMGFIVFSNLTSHDWARRRRLLAPKESNAIEALATS